MKPIREIAEQLQVPEEQLHYYGRYTAKLDLSLLETTASRTRGKLVLVTAVTPTAHGEGKTVMSIGLTQGLCRTGRRAVATLREPSLGPVFGIKGGATGGGKSQVVPSEMINLHFNGDFHAVSSANNLLAALIDSHLHHGNELRIDIDNTFWPRTLDMNDRALRHTIVGLGGKNNGVPRETGFVITAASEVMAILALAHSREDLRHRLSEIVIGLNLDGKPVRAKDLQATGAMMVLLNEAIMPNLVQTSEGTPAFVHAGPFANIAHGTSSVISQRMGLQLADWVVNETGFAADLGAEKYFDIVMPSSGLKPSVAVLIASARAVAAHGRDYANLDRHIVNLRKFGVPVVVAVNRFASDTQSELDALCGHLRDQQVLYALADVFGHGGEGGVELAEAVVQAAASDASPQPLYSGPISLEDKIRSIAREIYGASDAYFESVARAKLRRYTELGFAHLPVCMAKTQSSFSDNPKLLGAPSGFTLTVTDAHLSAGAGFVVVIAGNMLRMPGLGKSPQAFRMDVDERGEIAGLS
ncbi:MAG: formate--tetrahydrofolate ligase [Bryobacterales bacterium]|nr:formate--tetrahydrofolate ligase [Bryobacterales bacterium]